MRNFFKKVVSVFSCLPHRSWTVSIVQCISWITYIFFIFHLLTQTLAFVTSTKESVGSFTSTTSSTQSHSPGLKRDRHFSLILLLLGKQYQKIGQHKTARAAATKANPAVNNVPSTYAGQLHSPSTRFPPQNYLVQQYFFLKKIATQCYCCRCWCQFQSIGKVQIPRKAI